MPPVTEKERRRRKALPWMLRPRTRRSCLVDVMMLTMFMLYTNYCSYWDTCRTRLCGGVGVGVSAFLFSRERLNLAAMDTHTHLTDYRIRSKSKYFSFEYLLPPLPYLDESSAVSDREGMGNDGESAMYSAMHHDGHRKEDFQGHHNPELLSTVNLNHDLAVTYTNDPQTIKDWIDTHIIASPSDRNDEEGEASTIQVVGFDVESVPRASWIEAGAQHDAGPATIQISVLDAALVIQLTHRRGRYLTSLLKPLVKPLLHNPRAMLTGAGIDEDIMELYEFAPHIFSDVTGRFDLGGVDAPGVNHRVGLKNLVEGLLKRQFEKRRSISVSDWSQVPLSWDQILYSARDAWAGCAVATALAEKDPHQFAFDKLQSVCLEKERPVKQLIRRANKRRGAKLELKMLNRSHPPGADTYVELGGGVTFTTHPYWVHKQRGKLKQKLQSTKPDGMILFKLKDGNGCK
jgi:hypothetical protein